jgi:hypothetical protein
MQRSIGAVVRKGVGGGGDAHALEQAGVGHAIGDHAGGVGLPGRDDERELQRTSLQIPVKPHFRFPFFEQIAQRFRLCGIGRREVLFFRDVVLQVVECGGELGVVALVVGRRCFQSPWRTADCRMSFLFWRTLTVRRLTLSLLREKGPVES